jgi:flagellum-specific ATP synthase
VLCLIDSVTRFAMAHREISLSLGEAASARGYPPSTFFEMSRLLERAGPGISGTITAFFTVLVDGDDMNEPIADSVRGTLDGHIILDRAIAERGRYPAINILKSISRMVPKCLSDHEYELVKDARKWLSIYEDMSDLIRLGAYKRGSDSEVDRAIDLYGVLSEFLGQKIDECDLIDDGFERLCGILSNF